jgi:7-cyano-7-deazaguanine reductase
MIETFPNPRPGREFEIAIDCPEFPDAQCIELKALKYYLLDYRNKGIFYESATNQILDDLVAACAPKRMTVEGEFTPRGGIKTTVTATYAK